GNAVDDRHDLGGGNHQSRPEIGFWRHMSQSQGLEGAGFMFEFNLAGMLQESLAVAGTCRSRHRDGVDRQLELDDLGGDGIAGLDGYVPRSGIGHTAVASAACQQQHKSYARQDEQESPFHSASDNSRCLWESGRSKSG